jgi:hypothetical protein
MTCRLHAEPQKNKAQAATQKAIPQKTSKEAKEAFVIMGAYKTLAQQKKPITFETTVVAERYMQPMKLVYNATTQKFEPRSVNPGIDIKP